LTANRTQLDEFNLQCANPHTGFAISTNWTFFNSL